VTEACVVSGAASGIGRATLELFLSRGYSCLGIDRDEEGIDRLLTDLSERHGDRLSVVRADLVTDEEIPLDALEALGADGLKLTLVNNVGGSAVRPAGPGSHDWDSFAEVLAFNLKPLHELTRTCLGWMKEHGYGRIVNVASVAARRPVRTVDGAYAAAKAAVIGLSRHQSLELAEHGILVNAICPGVIASARMERRWAARSAEVNREVLSEIPLGRLGRPEEVAAVIYFLGSTSTYTTGSIVDVNGGMFLP
jgi:NAD(P)-dependent dehydrogenase (short-subunit alcohol dehydrogenase family)